MKRMLLLAAALFVGAAASAQRLSVATNLLDYADFGTLNVEGDVAVARQWTGGKVQYQEYNRGGIRSAVTDEGDRYGAGLSAGFTYMLHPHLNVSVGAGVWGGLQRYTVYSCPVCGITQDSGEKTFILPNDLALTLSYVF